MSIISTSCAKPKVVDKEVTNLKTKKMAAFLSSAIIVLVWNSYWLARHGPKFYVEILSFKDEFWISFLLWAFWAWGVVSFILFFVTG